MSKITEKLAGVQWLSGGAVWGVTGASAALGAWGWGNSATGLVAGVLVALAVGSEVLGVRMALKVEDAVVAKDWPRVGALAALLVGVVGMNAYSGARALHMIETDRAAPYEAAVAKRADLARDVARAEADLAAVPALPANVPAVRLAEYRKARAEELARAEPALAKARAALALVPPAAAPPASIGEVALALMLALVEALKAIAPWALATSRKRAQAGAGAAGAPLAAVDATSAARGLANRRWHPVTVAA